MKKFGKYKQYKFLKLIFREGRERNINGARNPPTRALTRESNWWPFHAQEDTQLTESHWPGQELDFSSVH